MTRLRTSDLEGVVAFLGEMQALETDEPFPSGLLGSLATLVPADSALFNERDRVRRELVDESYWCAEGECDEETGLPNGMDEWEFLSAYHPTNVFRLRTGHVGGLRLSDVHSRRTRQRYAYPVGEYFRHWGLVDLLDVRLSSSDTYTLCLGLESTSREFTERDRLVLDLLRPHLVARHREARLRRILAHASAALETLSKEGEAPGVVLLGREGDIEFASPEAFRLLASYLGHAGAQLPSELYEWWRDGSRAAFLLRAEATLLVVNAVGPGRGALLVSEQPATALPLTVREWDVMRCVAAGKTNAEIARMLWISPATVKKHLEHVYAKLGVRTRTAAIARLRPRLADRVGLAEQGRALER